MTNEQEFINTIRIHEDLSLQTKLRIREDVESDDRTATQMINTIMCHHLINERERQVVYHQIYLRMSHYQTFRTRMLKSRTRCEKCGSGEHLQIHHLNYDCLFRETPDDVKVVCPTCHVLMQNVFDSEREIANMQRHLDEAARAATGSVTEPATLIGYYVDERLDNQGKQRPDYLLMTLDRYGRRDQRASMTMGYDSYRYANGDYGEAGRGALMAAILGERYLCSLDPKTMTFVMLKYSRVLATWHERWKNGKLYHNVTKVMPLPKGKDPRGQGRKSL